MKSRYKFLESEYNLYFLTFTVVERIPVFTNSQFCDVIIENFKFYHENRNLKIFNYVIMDNHVHMIMSHKKDIGKVIQDFKKYTAKQALELLTSDSRQWI